MVVSDVTAILVAAAVANLLAVLFDRPADTRSWWLAVGILIPLWLLIAHASGLYRMSGRMIHVELSDEVGPTTSASRRGCGASRSSGRCLSPPRSHCCRPGFSGFLP